MIYSSIDLISKQLLKYTARASEVCEACLKQIQKTKKLNAFVTLTEETARRQAVASDNRRRKGESLGKLDGVPVAVKDNFCTEGILTTCGSHMLSNFIPRYNATVVSRLSDAGAVLVGKCNLDEFAMGSGTVDSIHGPTKNIWKSDIPYELYNKNNSHTASKEFSKFCPTQSAYSTCKTELFDWHIAGGSSGGSAVAVATGSCFAALGSDTGGSTRNPAAYCGVVGIKPTYGLVSRHGLIPLVNSLDVPGVLARSIEDATLVLNQIAGPDSFDSTTVERKFEPISLQDTTSLTGLCVGIPKEYLCSNMSDEMVCTWKRAALLLEEGGAKVIEVSLPHTSISVACYSVLNQAEVASNMARYDGLRFGIRANESYSTEQMYAETRCSGFNEVVRSRIFAGNYFLLSRNYHHYFVKALQIRRLIKNDFDTLWENGVDVLLTPTTLSSAPKFSAFKAEDNQTQCATQDYCTQPANMAGIPAVTLPISLSEDGLPLSLQLMAPMFKEDILLQTALWLQNAVEFPQLKILE